MGTQNSAYTFTGKLGNLHGYTRPDQPGKTFVSKNGGPTKWQYENSSSMSLTRQNANEFSGCNIATKEFYKWLPFTLRIAMSGSFRKYLKSVVKLKNADTSQLRGFRGVQYRTLQPDFSNIVLGTNLSPRLFSNLISSLYTVTPAGNRSSVTIDFTGGILPVDISFFAGATHIKVNSFIVGLSDYIWDNAIKTYVPELPEIIKNTVESSYFDIAVGSAGAFTLVPTLMSLPGIHHIALCVLWVEYYELVSGVYNLLNNSADVIVHAL